MEEFILSFWVHLKCQQKVMKESELQGVRNKLILTSCDLNGAVLLKLMHGHFQKIVTGQKVCIGGCAAALFGAKYF